MTNKKCDTQKTQKKLYISPKLSAYGNLQEITKSGTVSKTENVGHPSGKL